ncbi:MAG TPA: hypothetical protein VD815_10495, partial [Candidatus Saccharimonadales bacterium]|nr:hypothetical protein [Candidatus Saccharimonadales bacterium]
MNLPADIDVRAFNDMRFKLTEQSPYSKNNIKQDDNLGTESVTVEDNNNYYFKPNKVVIIGLGQLGLPVAKYVKECGFDAYGYDINQKTMQSAEANYGIKQA